MPPLFQVELEKMAGSQWRCFGVRVPRTLDYPTISCIIVIINLNPVMHRICCCSVFRYQVHSYYTRASC